MSNKCVIVLGMHRSGTSALAGVMSMLGVTPGDNLQPAEAEVNAKGFWEHTDIVALHDQFLEAFGSSWHDDRPLPDHAWGTQQASEFRQKVIAVLRRDFSNESMWVLKDPRMCRLLPLWHGIFEELGCQPAFVLVLRHPSEVASSLRKRDGLPEELACLLWLAHMLEAEYQTRGQRRVFVAYDRLLKEWKQTVMEIGQGIGVVWPVSIEAASSSITAFLDPTLRHHASAARLPEHLACQLAIDGFELLSAAQPDSSRLDHLRVQVTELATVVSPWSKRLQFVGRPNHNLRLSNIRLTQENEAFRMDVARIKGTASWRITKPLRFVWNTLLRVLPS